MKERLVLLRRGGVVVLAGMLIAVGASAQTAPKPRLRSVARIPILFERNVGQAPANAAFLYRAPWGSAEIGKGGFTIALPARPKGSQPDTRAQAPASRASEPEIVRIAFEGQAADALPQGGKVSKAVANDYAGPRKEQWHTRIPLCSEIAWRGVAPGIDFTLDSRDGCLWFEVMVRPGANVSDLGLIITGARRMSLDSSGRLELALASGRLVFTAPQLSARENRSGSTRRVAGGYRVDGPRVGFWHGALRDGESLLIDPQIAFSDAELLGDPAGQWDIVADTSSSVFVCHVLLSNSTIYALRVDDPTVPELTYVTHVSNVGLGSVTSDGAGRLWAAGASENNSLPIVGPAWQDTGAPSGSRSSVVVSFRPLDGILDRSTYLGDPNLPSGLSSDWAANGVALARHAQGEIAIGVPGSVSLFTTNLHQEPPGTFVYNGPGLASPFAYRGRVDGFFAILSADLSSLFALPFVGGASGDTLRRVAASREAFYALGLTRSSDLPVTAGAFHQTTFESGLGVGSPPSHDDLRDLFLVKFSLDGTMERCTYLGGPGAELPGGLAVTPDGEVVAALRILEIPFASGNTLVAGLSSDLASLSFLSVDPPMVGNPTFLEDDLPIGALPDRGSVVARFLPSMSTLPVSSDAFDAVQEQSEVIYVRRSSDGQISYTSFLGGSDIDAVENLSVDPDGGTWLVGETRSPDFPTTTAPPPPADRHAFIVKIDNDFVSLTLSKTDAPDPAFLGQPITYTLTAANTGALPASDCRIVDDLPAGFEVVTLPPGATASGQQVTIPLPELAPGDSATFSLGVAGTAGGTFSNVARVVCGGATRATATEPTTVLSVPLQPDLALNLYAPSTVSPDQVFTVSVRVRNLGSSEATNVTVVAQVPAKVIEITGVDLTGASIDGTGTRVFWSIGTLAGGADRTLTMTARAVAAGRADCRAILSATGLQAPGIVVVAPMSVTGVPGDIRIRVDAPVVNGSVREWLIHVEEIDGQPGPFYPLNVTVAFDSTSALASQAEIIAAGPIFPRREVRVRGTTNRWAAAINLSTEIALPQVVFFRAPATLNVTNLSATVTAPAVNEDDAHLQNNTAGPP